MDFHHKHDLTQDNLTSSLSAFIRMYKVLKSVYGQMDTLPVQSEGTTTPPLEHTQGVENPITFHFSVKEGCLSTL